MLFLQSKNQSSKITNTITVEKEKHNVSFFRFFEKFIFLKHKENKYNASIEKKITESRQEIQEGKGKTIAIEDLWK